PEHQPHTESRPEAAAAEPAGEPALSGEVEDLFVLPGETLAKYRGESSSEVRTAEPLEEENAADNAPYDEEEQVEPETAIEAAAEEPEVLPEPQIVEPVMVPPADGSDAPAAAAAVACEPEPQISVEAIEVVEPSEAADEVAPEAVVSEEGPAEA